MKSGVIRWNNKNNPESFRSIAALLAGLLVFTMLIGHVLPVFASSATVVTTEYFVDGTNGLDTRPGTLAQPWKTIQHAVDTAVPGSIIYVRAGTYNESVWVTRTGSAAAPFQLMSYPGELVTINGGYSPAIVPYTSASKYWTIEGFTLISSGPRTVNFDAWGCDGACNGIDHWTFRNNIIHGAVVIYGAYTLIEDNIIDGTYNNGNNGNGLHDWFPVSHHNIFRDNIIHNFTNRGIWTMGFTHDNLIENNQVYDITAAHEGMCIDLDGYATVEYRHTVRNNTLYNCAQGIQVENNFDSVVEYNIFYNNAMSAISVINYGPSYSNPGSLKCQVGGEYNQYGDTDGDNSCEGNLTNNILRYNTISNGGSQGGMIAIFRAGGVNILNNTLINGLKAALYLDSGVYYCPQIVIQNNTFSNMGGTEISVENITSLGTDSNNTFINANRTKVYQIRAEGVTLTLAEYKARTGKAVNSVYRVLPARIYLPRLFR